jgi:basic membrane protein A
MGKVAKDFPDIHFCIIDSYVDLPNVTGLEFKENEGSFLVGAIAGLMSKGQKVGFLGGVDIPLIHRFDNGFQAGAMYVSKALRANGMVLSQYISKDFSGFADPTGGYNVASNLYKQGAAIVFHAAGASGDGLFKAAEEAKKYSIGVDSDQGLIYASDKSTATQARAKWILTSMEKRVDNAVLAAATEFIKGNGSMSSGEERFGLKENGVGFADNKYNHALIAPYLAQVNKLKADIIAGTIVVPDENTDVAAWAKTLK